MRDTTRAARVRWLGLLSTLVLATVLPGCDASTSGTGSSAPVPHSAGGSVPRSGSVSLTGTTDAPSTARFPDGWVDEDVSFVAGGVRIYATYRHPMATTRGPAALLIAGSGIPDRNGDSPGAPEGSVRLLANQLALDGVATVRYDKLGSGRTGRAPGGEASLRLSTYSAGAAAALRFLAAQPRSDPASLSVYGHSEGGLYALLLATGEAGAVPHIARLGLIEPLSRPIFDVLTYQYDRQFALARTAGTLTAAQASTYRAQFAAAVRNVRAGRPPGPVPAMAAAPFSANLIGYNLDEDRHDPAALAAKLPSGTSVLLTCSTNDVQVRCADTDHLDQGLTRSRATVRYVHLTGMDHALKPDSTPNSSHNDSPLPMAPGLASAIRQFAT